MIEEELANDELWYFINGKINPAAPRIEYLFKMIVQCQETYDSGEKSVFRFFQSRFDEIVKTKSKEQRIAAYKLVYCPKGRAAVWGKNHAVLKKFTYETRIFSRYFCEKLSCFTINEYFQDNIKVTIINQKWFLTSWLHDHSVSSMLAMLEKIDNLLRMEKMCLWDKLVQDKNTAPVTFFYTPLESFDLTDDLYIKI